jgi:hypothetical protein
MTIEIRVIKPFRFAEGCERAKLYQAGVTKVSPACAKVAYAAGFAVPLYQEERGYAFRGMRAIGKERHEGREMR